MKREIIKTSKAPKAIGPYSQAIKCECSGFVFCSGQISMKPDTREVITGGASEQTRQVLENLKAVLEKAGLGLENVVKTTIYLTSMDDFNLMNEIYEQYFSSNPPARATLEVASLPKNVKVEIEAIACY
ncbi:MAG: RidA family protein [candidate division Zixibacteria bacterium]|nr:RidA family protein [candidate division Zixibacteria bacterium]NIR63479.1 RidA family protein [candidate division Zixibacteria bacterium]NIS17722.1 RidA family protein [candidate division Zixibacteria bacterium]NIS45434.1 RidA family protein [candidate division Zixibacteria bacterium]NIT54038.1 RidA family protein [candidate division Zixibacteria bacterium]